MLELNYCTRKTVLPMLVIRILSVVFKILEKAIFSVKVMPYKKTYVYTSVWF